MDRNCVGDCQSKVCDENKKTGDNRQPVISCKNDCKMSCPE
jgi:hypothetical protein